MQRTRCNWSYYPAVWADHWSYSTAVWHCGALTDVLTVSSASAAAGQLCTPSVSSVVSTRADAVAKTTTPAGCYATPRSVGSGAPSVLTTSTPAKVYFHLFVLDCRLKATQVVRSELNGLLTYFTYLLKPISIIVTDEPISIIYFALGIDAEWLPVHGLTC